MLKTSVSGYDPKWDQPLSANDKIELKGAHELQSFAFSDKETTSLLVINLSRTERRPVAVAGACAPQGTVTVKTLTSGKITDSNEVEDKVKLVTREEENVIAGKSEFELPPFSMTVLTAANHGCTPVKPTIVEEAAPAKANAEAGAVPVVPAKNAAAKTR
jgi:alpha-L-arabinofuranosidase